MEHYTGEIYHPSPTLLHLSVLRCLPDLQSVQPLPSLAVAAVQHSRGPAWPPVDMGQLGDCLKPRGWSTPYLFPPCRYQLACRS